MATHLDLGRRGEEAAATYLTSRGWEVLERNWLGGADGLRGELDLVVARGDVLAVVEVKTRRQGPTRPAHAVTGRKLRQLRRLAALWLSHASGGWRLVRVDVVEVEVAADGQVLVTHLEDVG